MLVALVISGILMAFYEIADTIEGLFEGFPLWMYKSFQTIAYLIVCCLVAGFFACDQDQVSYRILIVCLAIYWSSRFIKDLFNYKELERQNYEELNEEEKEEEDR